MKHDSQKNPIKLFEIRDTRRMCATEFRLFIFFGFKLKPSTHIAFSSTFGIFALSFRYDMSLVLFLLVLFLFPFSRNKHLIAINKSKLFRYSKRMFFHCSQNEKIKIFK